jgi:hypothetical protein
MLHLVAANLAFSLGKLMGGTAIMESIAPVQV